MASTKPLEKLKKKVSAGSVAGKLRDQDKRIQEELKKAGVAKAGRTSAKPKAKTRLA